MYNTAHRFRHPKSIFFVDSLLRSSHLAAALATGEAKQRTRCEWLET